MAFRHGKLTVFKIGTVGAPATPTDISGYLTDVGAQLTADSAETSVFNVTDKTYLAGLKDGQFPLTGIFDAAVDAIMNALLGFDNNGAGVNIEYGPEGSTTGRVKYTGAVIVVAYGKTNPIGGAVGWTATLQKTGALALGAY